MTDETEKQETKVKVEDLPKQQEELTAEEEKKVEGGERTAGVGILRSTDGGSTWTV